MYFSLTVVAAFVFVVVVVTVNSVNWELKHNWQGQDFFQHFDFMTENDPTGGYVNYVDYNTAWSKGYVSAATKNVYIGCDHTNIASGRGRDSTRLESIDSWNYDAMYIMQATHMPFGCGSWPGYWMYGPNWPNDGEIDILEGANVNTRDFTTIHTDSGCSMNDAPRNYTGYCSNGGDGNCAEDASNGGLGCEITCPTDKSYGQGYNDANGGVYAMEWTSKGFRLWFWPMDKVPSNVYATHPDPDHWGIPYAAFPFGSWCPASHFKDMKLVIDLTFCGNWAGAVFSSECPGLGSCDNYVQYNPQAFDQAYWLIDFINIYE